MLPLKQVSPNESQIIKLRTRRIQLNAQRLYRHTTVI